MGRAAPQADSKQQCDQQQQQQQQQEKRQETRQHHKQGKKRKREQQNMQVQQDRCDQQPHQQQGAQQVVAPPDHPRELQGGQQQQQQQQPQLGQQKPSEVVHPRVYAAARAVAAYLDANNKQQLLQRLDYIADHVRQIPKHLSGCLQYCSICREDLEDALLLYRLVRPTSTDLSSRKALQGPVGHVCW